ncbi:MAG: hypothetical protein KDD28_17860, partial [Phaeodactylibacter sp.]|nr:hypothetical protein [Phaeodactylibacter sp.]
MAQLNDTLLQGLFEEGKTEAEAQQILNDYLNTFRISNVGDGKLFFDLGQKTLMAELGTTDFNKIAGAESLLEKASLGTLGNTQIRILGGVHESDNSPTVEEIRFDWEVSLAETPTLSLPAIELTAPSEFLLSLVIQNSSGNGHLPHHAYLVATLDKDKAASFSAQSSFAWKNEEEDGADREVQNDDKRTENEEAPLLSFALDFSPAAGATGSVSIVLLEFDLDSGGLPGFFQLAQTPLAELDRENPDANKTALLAISDFSNADSGSWSADLDFNLPLRQDEDGNENPLPFTLPFLNNKGESGAGDNGNSGGIEQFIEIIGIGDTSLALGASEITVPIGFEIKFGSLSFGSGLEMAFNWTDFSFQVRHSGGIDFLIDEQIKEFSEFMGLNWRFIAA